MKEQEVTLKAYREEIEVLQLTMEVPSYDYDDERRKMFPKYEDVLLRLFNNKRENKEILKIRNYYDSNHITIEVNLTSYLEDSYDKNKEECIEYLKAWFSSGVDVSNEQIKTQCYKGYIYKIPTYENKLEYIDVENYLELED